MNISPGLPLPLHPTVDTPIWGPTSGTFSVKSTTWLAYDIPLKALSRISTGSGKWISRLKSKSFSGKLVTKVLRFVTRFLNDTSYPLMYAPFVILMLKPLITILSTAAVVHNSWNIGLLKKWIDFMSPITPPDRSSISSLEVPKNVNQDNFYYLGHLKRKK